MTKELNYYKNKASENYAETTLEVLNYIEKLENKLNEAINYTRCSTQLKDKPKLNFEDWYITYGYAKSVKGNFVKEGTRYTAEEMQFKYDYNMP